LLMKSKTSASLLAKFWATEAAEHGDSPGHVIPMRDGEAWCQTCGRVFRPVGEQALPQSLASDSRLSMTRAKHVAREPLPQVPDGTASPSDPPLLAQPADAIQSGDEVLPVALHELRAALHALGAKLDDVQRGVRAANPDIDALADELQAQFVTSAPCPYSSMSS
jgi:hypothetical protein